MVTCLYFTLSTKQVNMVIQFNVPIVLVQQYLKDYPSLAAFIIDNQKVAVLRIDTDMKQKGVEFILNELRNQIIEDKKIAL